MFTTNVLLTELFFIILHAHGTINAMMQQVHCQHETILFTTNNYEEYFFTLAPDVPGFHGYGSVQA